MKLCFVLLFALVGCDERRMETHTINSFYISESEYRQIWIVTSDGELMKAWVSKDLYKIKFEEAP